MDNHKAHFCRTLSCPRGLIYIHLGSLKASSDTLLSSVFAFMFICSRQRDIMTSEWPSMTTHDQSGARLKCIRWNNWRVCSLRWLALQTGPSLASLYVTDDPNRTLQLSTAQMWNVLWCKRRRWCVMQAGLSTNSHFLLWHLIDCINPNVLAVQAKKIHTRDRRNTQTQYYAAPACRVYTSTDVSIGLMREYSYKDNNSSKKFMCKAKVCRNKCVHYCFK